MIVHVRMCTTGLCMHVHAHMQVKNMSVMYGSQPDRVAGLISKDMLGFIANINVATCTCTCIMSIHVQFTFAYIKCVTCRGDRFLPTAVALFAVIRQVLVQLCLPFLLLLLLFSSPSSPHPTSPALHPSPPGAGGRGGEGEWSLKHYHH